MHGRSNVGCQACHGGNPEKTDKKGAHEGVLPSTDPQSLAFFTKIPETCGACHQRALKAFAGSPHATELAKTGRVPNCLTCHGSMADRSPTPRDLEVTCAICHRSPTGTFKTLAIISENEAALKRLAKQRKAARHESPDLDWELASAMEVRLKALDRWHALDMAGVLEATQKPKHK